jgi:branched-chain amino acid transport system permease protein
MLAGMLATGAFAYLIGKPILRLRGHYLAMGTLGMGSVVYILFREGGLFTGGSDGIHSIPRLAVGSFEVWPIQRYYFLVWALALVVIVLSLNIVNSRVGRALRSIHGSEVAANTMGVDTAKYKLQVLVVSAMYASLAGSLYAHFQAAVSPIPFTFGGSLELVVMSSVGGIASIWGAPFGVTIIYVIREFLRARLHDLLRGAGGEHEVIVYGILLMVIMIFMPEGLTAGLAKALRRTGRRTVQPSARAGASASDSSRTSAS